MDFPWFSSAHITSSFSLGFVFFHRHSNKHPGNQSLIAANSPASDSPRMGFCCISQQPKGYSSGKTHEIIKKNKKRTELQWEKKLETNLNKNDICWCGVCSLNVANTSIIESFSKNVFSELHLDWGARSLPATLLPQLHAVRYKHIPPHILLKMKWTKTCMETWPSPVSVAVFLHCIVGEPCQKLNIEKINCRNNQQQKNRRSSNNPAKNQRILKISNTWTCSECQTISLAVPVSSIFRWLSTTRSSRKSHLDVEINNIHPTT